MFDNNSIIGVVGAGAMGAGIAQVASTAGHNVILFDVNAEQLNKAKAGHEKIMARLVEKGKVNQETADGIKERIQYVLDLNAFAPCSLIIEAIVENIDIKKDTFGKLEEITGGNCILASNTSSLSIAAISSAVNNPGNVLGIHFFNPAPLMPLVEIIPSVSSDEKVVNECKELINSWGKTTVSAKDTPGFIVNRVARPFYGEAIRIYEEGVADFATIDWAMKELGGFRMGPFELMDYIGNDINYTVTETVFTAFFYDPRYKPSFTQKRMMEAGRLGRKSGKGYYDYSTEANPVPDKNEDLGLYIKNRILVMLINEAIDASFLHIASREDIDLAMTKGVNYPKGLLKWADEMGLDVVLNHLESLQLEYGEDRYRPSPLLKRLVRKGKSIY